MANYEINEEQEVLTKAMRMIETGDPVHADVYNVLFSALLNNDVFLEKLANKMVQQAMISHVMDSTNSNMVLGADQGPVITKLIDKVQEQVTVLNTKTIFEKIPPKKGDLDTIANINSALDNWSNSMSDRIFYIGLLPLGIAHTTFGGGTLNLFGSKTNATHEWQMLIKYDTVGIRIFTRCKTAGTWQAWVTK